MLAAIVVPKGRENIGDSLIFKADIELLSVCMVFRTSWPKMGVWEKIGEGVVRY